MRPIAVLARDVRRDLNAVPGADTTTISPTADRLPTPRFPAAAARCYVVPGVIAMAEYTLSGQAAEFYESTFVPALFAPWGERLVEAADRGRAMRCWTSRAGPGWWPGPPPAITGPSVTGVDAELLPIADAMDAGTRSRIEADARTALTPFIGADGSIAAPIEVHLIAAG
jgi:hypothetical protein